METRILSIAQQLIKRIGIKSVTMEGIAVEMGISKKTIYHFFEGKTDLVYRVFSIQIATKKESLLLARVNADNAIEEAFLSWNIIEDFVTGMTNEVRQQLNKQYVQASKEVYDFEHGFLHYLIKSNIENGITAELYRSNVNAEIISRYMLEILLLHSSLPVLQTRRFSNTETEDQILNYHLHSIATEEGGRMIKKYKDDYLAYSSPYK